VVVGRGLADGVIELKDRRSGDRRDIALADAVGEIGALLAVLP
jgi:prolyl-tRNA synthetase